MFDRLSASSLLVVAMFWAVCEKLKTMKERIVMRIRDRVFRLGRAAVSRSRRCVITFALCTAATLIRGADTDGVDALSTRPVILGHRGALMLAPENTSAAFGLCLATGTDIELDVWPTKDGELVVIHDGTVNRTTNGTGRVAELTLGQIQKLDAGSWFHADFAGERVPTLSEALRFVISNERRPTTVAINLKPVDDTVITGVIGAVRDLAMFERTFLFDLSLDNARRFKQRDARIQCASSPRTQSDIEQALKLDIIDVIWTGPQPGVVIDRIHEAGKVVYITLVNDAAQWLRLKADGADGICTNHPIRMKDAAAPPPADRMWDHYLAPAKRHQYKFRAPVPPAP